jgi:hypothetical protein
VQGGGCAVGSSVRSIPRIEVRMKSVNMVDMHT